MRVGSGLKMKCCIICGEKKDATNEKHDATINLPQTLLVSKASSINVDEKKRVQKDTPQPAAMAQIDNVGCLIQGWTECLARFDTCDFTGISHCQCIES